jgi:Tol biopolymer transport system component/predicted Ser/Thr protein kinase
MDLKPGDKLGDRYQLLSKLGEGGMGEVWKARDTELDRDVAVKISKSEFTARFKQEARAMAAFNHPNISQIYDVGPNYIVMEWIDGASPKGPLPVEKAVAHAGLILDALDAAHRKGFTHRDLKPANVMVTAKGVVKLLDFGLAKQEQPQTFGPDDPTAASLSKDGQITGTLQYMSPEQLNGKKADARSDIFAFGCVLYEMLSGKKAFSGSTSASVIAAIMEREPEPLQTAPPLDRVIRKCLAKDPDDRFQNARDVKTAMLWATETTVVAAPGKVRLRWAFAVAAGLGLAAIASTGARWLSSDSGPWVNPLENARFIRLTDFEGSELDASLSPDGKLVAFIADRDGPFYAYIGQVGVGNFVNMSQGRFPELFHEQIRSVGFSDDSTELWLRVSRPDPTNRTARDIPVGVWTIPVLGGAPRLFLDRANLALWSPDGRSLVYFGPAPGDPIFVGDRRGANPKQIFVGSPGEHAHYESWSADGRFIYFARGYRSTEMDVWRVPASGGVPERLTHHNSKVTYPTALNDRTLLYIASGGNGVASWLYAMDLKTRETRRANLGVEEFLSIAASNGPNGPMTRLAASVANPRGTLWTVPIMNRIAREEDTTRVKLPAVRAISPRYGPNYLLYLSSKGGDDGLWKFQDGASTELWKSPEETLAAPAAVSPDGNRICFTVRKGERQHLYVMTAEGLGIRSLADSLDIRDAPSWSPDGKSVAASVDEGEGGKIYRIPVDGSSPERLVDDVSYNPVWSPDGRIILYSFSPQGALFPIRAVMPDRRPFKLPDVSARGEGGRVRFLPDGKSFVVLTGPYRDQNFYLMNLETGVRRQLTELKRGSKMRDFDISPDGKQIVFDRVDENSDVVLIDLPAKGR